MQLKLYSFFSDPFNWWACPFWVYKRHQTKTFFVTVTVTSLYVYITIKELNLMHINGLLPYCFLPNFYICFSKLKHPYTRFRDARLFFIFFHPCDKCFIFVSYSIVYYILVTLSHSHINYVHLRLCFSESRKLLLLQGYC